LTKIRGIFGEADRSLIESLYKQSVHFVIADMTLPSQPIIFATPAFFELTEYSQEEVLGYNCRFLQGPDTDPAAIDRLRTAIKQRRAVEEGLLNYTKSGKPFWNLLCLTPLCARGSQEVTHYLGVQRDITSSVEKCSERNTAQLRRSLTEENLYSSDLVSSSILGYGMQSMIADMVNIRDQAAEILSDSSLTVYLSDDLTILDVTGTDPKKDVSFLGYSVDELLGKPLRAVLAETEEHDLWMREQYCKPVMGKHKNGWWRGLIATPGLPVAWGSQKVLPLTIQDIAQLEDLEQTLKKKDETIGFLETAIDKRKQFLNYIFHEVRQPFSVLTLGLSHVLDTCQDIKATLGPQEEARMQQMEELLTTAEEMQVAAGSMNTILNDVLLLEKLQAGRLDIEPELYTVAELVQLPCKHLERIFKQKDITVTQDIDDRLLHGLKAKYDRHRLSQVMYNLLTNANKFTAKGGQVGVRLEQTGPVRDNNLHIEVSVEDNGVGIPLDKVNSLFQPYRQIRSGELQGGGGTGLGLAISKELVAAHGGDMGVDSEPGKGSRFWFKLSLKLGSGEDAAPKTQGTSGPSSASFIPPSCSPACKPDAALASLPHSAAASSSAPPAAPCAVSGQRLPVSKTPDSPHTALVPSGPLAPPPASRPPRRSSPTSPPSSRSVPLSTSADVLLVDDQPVILRLLKAQVERCGVSAATASSGEEVVQQFQTGQRWRLIFTDSTMGGMHGPEMVRHLRAMDCTCPIVGLTGNSGAGEVEEFFASGINQLVIKPLHARDMQRILSEYVGSQQEMKDEGPQGR
jgi:PAS domain S-box-containing protein